MARSSRRGAAIRAVVCGLLCSGLPAACGIPDYRFADPPDASGGAPGVTRPRCATDNDCSKYATTKTCDVAGGHCVECVPALDTGASNCKPGLFCNVNRCAVGCASDADCGNGLSCDLALHQCRDCTSNQDCGIGTGCKDGYCIPNCTSDASCPAGYTCCNGVCAAVGSDPLHCGSCERACADREDCINGDCGPGSSCATGFGDCDGKPANGCETNLSTDRKNCGACGKDCGTDYCNGGLCSALPCDADTADCNHSADDGCETRLTTAQDCGVCNKTCSDFNGTPACVNHACTITCDAGFSDCDKNAETGCEVNVLTDALNCGACNVACSNDHGRTVCLDGVCTPTCAKGFSDCDGKPENGCETDVQSDIANCGSCLTSCSGQNAIPHCVSGVCSSECKPGFDHCNGQPGIDCEADLTQPSSCGSCSNICNQNGGTATCTDGVCGITCKKNFADCNKNLEDGCEIDTTSNVKNCGGCGDAFACKAPAQGSVACVNGACVVSQCADPLADCNGDSALPGGDKCETNVNTDPKNCGGCGLACYFPNATSICVNKVCTRDKCSAGFADCTTALGCETQLGTIQNCTKCGEACTNAHGGTSCSASGCVPTCAIGWGDCDGIKENGCETQLNAPNHCGSCTGTCSRPNATTSCASGTCEITGCNAGYGDCDKETPTPNGCEAPLTTLNNCGGCNKACDIPNAAESCATGSCVQGACNAGFMDCSPTIAGCETQLGTQSNCNTCGDLCQTTNVHVTSNTCTGTVPNAHCDPKCQPGFDNCNGSLADGCETDIGSVANCGACFAACSLPNTATYACSSGSCQVVTCKSGFANCNSSQTDGCELPVSTDIAHCGGCNTACSSNHGTPSCTNGVCSTACSGGYGDCNADPLDGCEHDTTSDPNACGNCTTKCTTGAAFCVNSACRQHLNIGVGAPVNGSSSGGANLSISHTLKNGPGSYRLVVVGVASRGNSPLGRPSSVKYGTASMKLEREAVSGNQAWSGIYTLPNASLPAANTTSTVLITAGSTSGTFGMFASVVELTNVEQATAFIENVGGSAHGQCSGPVSDSVTTATDGSLVYGVTSFYGAFSSASAASGQVLLLPSSAANQLGGIAGYVIPGVAGPFAMSWTANACDTSAQSLVSIKPAVTP